MTFDLDFALQPAFMRFHRHRYWNRIQLPPRLAVGLCAETCWVKYAAQHDERFPESWTQTGGWTKFQVADRAGKENDLDRSDIVWLDGGTTHVGTDRPEIRSDGESPRRQTTLGAFGISRFAVTVAEFARFIDETGWTTSADRFGWSYVFRGLLEDAIGPRPRDLPRWNAVDRADWKFPAGQSYDKALGKHPVTHVSHADATAFAAWAGGTLPTEAEWEHAARGDRKDARHTWGDEEPDDDKNILCNIWQGEFPYPTSIPKCNTGHFRSERTAWVLKDGPVMANTGPEAPGIGARGG